MTQHDSLIEIDTQDLPHGSALEAGLMQTKTPFSTAVQVIRRRNLMGDVLPRCLEEAAIAGNDFYYSYSQGGKIVEGLTAGAALAIARNMGNNAIDIEVRETAEAWYFTATYICLESGFNIRRTFRQNKRPPQTKSGKDIYSGDRGTDVVYQIGQSKAIRNVVLNAVPNWLAKKVFDRAKENVITRIKEMGVPKAAGMIVAKIEQLKIPMDGVLATYGKPETWGIEKIVMLTGAVRSIEDGRERIEDVFPDGQSAEMKADGKKQSATRRTAGPREAIADNKS